jgi:hypothetical protein
MRRHRGGRPTRSEIAAIVWGCNVGKPRVNLSFGAPHKNGDLGDVVGFLTLLGF